MKTSAFIAVSLDGYIARQGGEIDWLLENSQSDPTEDYGYGAFFKQIDAIVLGRNSYEQVLSFAEWPYESKKVFILSHKAPQIPITLTEKVIHRCCSAHVLYKELEANGYTHAYIDGGKIIQSFIQAGLLHEITITWIPILIGAGIPLFGDLPRDLRLRLVASQAYTDGLTQSKYQFLYDSPGSIH